MVLKKLLVYLLFITLSCTQVYAESESKYSDSLARMEREWLYKEFPDDEDIVRISRIEEKVFGTIHDNDLKFRYKQLLKAFDAKKKIRSKRRYYSFSGIPTSNPIKIDELVN